jgi:hypothetical protein
MSTDPLDLIAAADAAPDRQASGDFSLLDSLPDANQLTMFDDGGSRLDRAALAAIRTGPGRRPGSRNKRQKQIADFIVQNYGDPLLSQANAAFMPLEVLVRAIRAADQDEGEDERFAQIERIIDKIGPHVGKDMAQKLGTRLLRMMSRSQISALDVWKEQNAIKAELTPYVYGKQPVALNVNGRADVILNIPGLSDPTHLAEIIGESEVTEEDIARISFQPVNDAEFVAVDDD